MSTICRHLAELIVSDKLNDWWISVDKDTQMTSAGNSVGYHTVVR